MLTADLEIRIQAFENKCHRRMFGISHRQYSTQTNDFVWQQINISNRRQKLFFIYRYASLVVMVRPCLRLRYTAKNHTRPLYTTGMVMNGDEFVW